MKFYNREKELASLEKVRQVSFSVHSQMSATYRQDQSYIQELRGYSYGVLVCQPKQ